MPQRKSLIRLGLALALALPAGLAAQAHRRASIEAPIRFLADDLLEGRGPGGPRPASSPKKIGPGG
jgi:hypothetical protein